VNALERGRRTGINSDFSLIFEHGKSGISFVAHAGGNDTLADVVMALGKARKYKTKADTWLALGSMISGHRMIGMAAFSKARWSFDPMMEKFIQVALKRGVAINATGEKMGRNDQCVCDSGKKFKKCCGHS
jgi:SEC-C motif